MRRFLRATGLLGVLALQACNTTPGALPPWVAEPAPAASAAAADPSAASAASAPPGAEASGGATAASAPDTSAPASGPGRYAQRHEGLSFAAGLAQRQPELPVERTLAALAQAQYQPSVARLIMPAATPAAKNWAQYRARFVEPKRIQAGQQFMTAQAAALQAAEQRWGVPAPIIAAIIGVETFYGRNTGNFRALDALATLAFDFPTGRSDRSAFFRDELEALIRLSLREGQAPESYLGSYAGALGLPQFMPSSWLKYAVDFDGDGRIDLQGSPSDAIGSVANFLAAHGWQAGLRTHYGVEPPAPGTGLQTLLAPDILPSFTPDDMAAHGARLSLEAQQHPGLLALVELKNGDKAPSYVAGTDNFWVLTRYNRSSYYALSIIDLAQALSTTPAISAR